MPTPEPTVQPPPGRRVWVTRTQPGAEATAQRLRVMGLTPVVAPLLRVRPLSMGRLDLTEAEALAFTSRAAVDAFAALTPRRDWPVFAVGAATAARARAAGFVAVRAADGDVAALADLIARADAPPARVLNPTAREPADDLAARLANRGVAVRAVAVYETVAADLDAVPADLDALLIHSAKAARRAAALLDARAASGLAVLALSEAAAEPLADLAFRIRAVAERPDEQALLALLQDV